MRLRYALFAASLLAAPLASAQLLIEENFDYAAGTVLGSATTPQPATNATTNWTTHSGTGGQILVSSPGLTLATTPAYPSQAGNAITLVSPTQSEDVSRTFTAQSTGSVYASFLLNQSVAPTTTGTYFFHLGPSTLGTSFRGRLWVRDNGAGAINFGLSTGGNTATWGTSSFPLNTTMLLVVRYDIASGTADDAIKLYVLQAGATLSAEPATAEVTAANDGTNDPANIGTVAFREGTSTGTPTGNSGTTVVDGLRVATSWNFATGTASDAEARPGNDALAIWGRRVRLTTTTPGTANVALYDVLGREVATLFAGSASGTVEARLPDGLTPGVYVVRAVGDGLAAAKTVVVQ